MERQKKATFNSIIFEEKIHQELSSRVKGYSVVIANEAGLRAKVSGGWAQAPGDGQVPMKTYISSGVGSVSKVLTAVALLHLFDRHKLSSASVQEQLDMPIWDKLPLKWKETNLAGKNFEKVTYRNLLQHKSGIASDQIKPPKEYRQNKIGFYFILQKGVDESRIGKREYSNYAMVLVGLLVAAIAYPEEVSKFHQDHKNLGDFEYAKALRLEYLRLYEKYMREEIFSQALEPIAPTCRPEREFSDDQYAKSYSTWDDKAGTSPQRNDPCNPQGGWFLSAQELAQFARTLAFTNRYIGPTTRASLYDPSHKDDRIVYASLVGHSGFEKELGQNRWAYHGGDVLDYQAALVKLPYNYYGIAMVNSDEIGSKSLAQLLIDSFYEATRNQPISLAKHGITEGKYQQYASELADHGSMPDWINFYDDGDKTFVNVIFRPTQTGWLARHGLTSKEYQDLYDKHVKNGFYKLKQIDSYVKSGQLRYAVILIKGDSTNMPAYHGITSAEHQEKFDTWTAQGFVPVNLSVTSIGGERRYTGFYEKKQVGGLAVKTFLTGEQYQKFVDKQIDEKREIAYLKSYVNNGVIHYSAIFYGNIDRPQVLRHGMTSSDYQHKFDQWVNQGFALKLVTAVRKGNSQLFTAVWQKGSS